MNIKELLGLAGRPWCKRVHQHILEEVTSIIYIQNAHIADHDVIALIVNGVAVDYIGYPTDVNDPDGYTIHENPRHLIQQMQHLREQEYDRRATEHKLYEEMKKYHLTFNDL